MNHIQKSDGGITPELEFLRKGAVSASTNILMTR
nr:MAG TPA: hypothetical protein [Caudoviricetes sp.]